MPGAAQTGLGLSYKAQNTSAALKHPIEKCGKSMVEQETQQCMNLAMKHEVMTPFFLTGSGLLSKI